MIGMLDIDGSSGEGGGQVLRTALTLSLLTSTPFHLFHIRARRSKPGLRPQHLAAVRAAGSISEAGIEGDCIGSAELRFSPGEIRPGQFHFDIGTAGSTSLLLQTILLPLSRARRPSHITALGGTHNRWSPCFHYLELQWKPFLEKLGLDLELHLERAGFYPRGGGCVKARVRPSGELQPLWLEKRGRLQEISAISAVAGLPRRIAERQREEALRRLQPWAALTRIRVEELESRSPGTFLLLLARFQEGQACYFSLGEKGKPAETVAAEAAEALKFLLNSQAGIDEFLADQLILPLALAAGRSHYTTPRVTQHLLTQADIVRCFLPVEIQIEGALSHPGRVTIQGSGLL